MPRSVRNTRSLKTISQTNGLTLGQARKFTREHPQQASGWKALGEHLIKQHPQEAQKALEQAHKLDPDDLLTLSLLAQVEDTLSNDEQALERLAHALEINSDFGQGHIQMARILYKRGEYSKALSHVDHADRLKPGQITVLFNKANILYKLYKYDEASAIYDDLLRRQPMNSQYWNNAGNVKRDQALFTQADSHFLKAIALDGNDSTAFSNRITTLHYRPDYSRDQIFQACAQWQTLFGPAQRPSRPQNDASANRPLRIGMFSDGFRGHPVGWMITAMLERLDRNSIQIFAYSTNNITDRLTSRIQAASSQWVQIQQLSDQAFAQRLRDDKIDILFDLCGHNSGTRMKTVTMEPAPLIVKWVGGLINTTGVDAIDYLLTDSIESPKGEDTFYTEKLIRLPDDYICYTPPPYLPDVAPLPALANHFVTLGCFNNPTKVNEVVLEHWAKIMRDIPGSRLLLKGHQYNSASLCDRIRTTLYDHGVDAERVTMEGSSNHKTLLDTYNRVDIALDPWPYSGGLTTVEAMLMGVPVVTLPGPTFAGRHSATHLVNAGMPELVVNNWDEYRSRVIGLAGDLDSLAIIRSRLRGILLQSPVCDGRRFAGHFTTAVRAIWQRYCEGHAPAALTIDKKGDARFEGESEPVVIKQPEAVNSAIDDFSFSFKGKIVMVDNGAMVIETARFFELHKLGIFSAVAFDPASRLNNVQLLQHLGELHHYPHITLGNGQEATLYVCMDPAKSATLEPMSAMDETNTVIARIPVHTTRLDDISGLENIDWLVLDNLNDSVEVLESGGRTLSNVLLVQARVNFLPSHTGQPDLGRINHWMSCHGFEFYNLINLQHYSHLQAVEELSRQQATQLLCADGLFIPSKERLSLLTDNQRLKLAFLLHSVYDIHDLTYSLLEQVNAEQAHIYLSSNHYLPAVDSSGDDPSIDSTAKGTSDNTTIPDTPRMSSNEIALFSKCIDGVRRYFEYGSGGSTKLAVRHCVAVFGVESDLDWVNRLKQETGPLCKVDYVDIGPTKEWGFPVDMTNKDKFRNYSEHIHQYTEHFDLILVDGRFRVACTVNAIEHTLKTNPDPASTLIFIHDFWNRAHYHPVLQLLEAVERVDTAAVLKIRPNLNKHTMKQILNDHLLDPR